MESGTKSVIEKLIDKVPLPTIIIILLLLIICILSLGYFLLRKYANKGRSVKFWGISIGEDQSLLNDREDLRTTQIDNDNYCLEIHHISLPVKNLWESKKFYSQVLKLKELKRPEVFEKLFPGEWYEFPSGQQLHLVLKEDATYRPLNLDFGNKIGPDIHFAIRLSSKRFNELRREIIQRDDVLKEEKLFPVNVGQLYLLDPDNHIIELTDIEKEQQY